MKEFLIPKDISIKQAMKQMDRAGRKTLFVVDSDSKLFGALTDGDIRRWLLNQGSLEEKVIEIINKTPKFADEDYNKEEVQTLMLKEKIECIPVIDNSQQVCKILLWEDMLGSKITKPNQQINIPIVIMAGGQGRRLDPFTRILPKPLIPIGENPIIRIIMNKFNEYGIKDFYVSVNHKSKMIKAYFEDVDIDYNITFIEEEKPLGTAGCLSFLNDKVNGAFIVTNCDIVIKCDYDEIIQFHKSNSNDITIMGAYRHFIIPYGVCTTEAGGKLTDIKEKPEYDFLVNTGMYVLESRVLKFVPENDFFLMTDLIKKIKAQGGRVGVFPISEKSWIDIGQWDEYQKAIKDFVADE